MWGKWGCRARFQWGGLPPAYPPRPKHPIDISYFKNKIITFYMYSNFPSNIWTMAQCKIVSQHKIKKQAGEKADKAELSSQPD